MKNSEQPKVYNLQPLTIEQAASVAAGNSPVSEEFAGKNMATTYLADARPPHGGGRPPFDF